VGLEMERVLAPAFVMSPEYGTRLTTVILIDRDNKIQFYERSFLNHQPDSWDEVCYNM